jgi:DNA repair exonuclease SbcCD ATPase subunit
MDIKSILKKVAEGKELTAEEKDFLTNYDPDASDGRIPKSRLDKEIEKYNTEKKRADELDAKLSELNEKLEELENSGKSEAEKAKAASDKELAKLQKQVADLTKERDEAKENFANSERTSKIAKLAAKHSFSDAEYLDYLTNAKQLDLDDDTATAEYMKELGKSKPELFKSTAKPGGGTGTGGKAVSSAKERMDELMKKDSLTTREADEVIELQQKIQAEGSGEANNKGE